LRAHYNIEDFIYYSHHKREEHGHLTRLAVNPIFLYLTKYFVKEILRKSYRTSLYYPIFPKYSKQNVGFLIIVTSRFCMFQTRSFFLKHLEQYSLITTINYMVPVRYREQIEYNLEELGVNAPSNEVLDSKYSYPVPFALNHINRKLLLEPKVR
jgi:hypothetical protein